MRTVRMATAIALAILAATPCLAPNYTTTYTEKFDTTIDYAGWRVGPTDEIVSSGGNPGSYLHVPSLDAAAPQITCVRPGNDFFRFPYRASGVTSLGIDVNLFNLDISNANRPITLVLYNDIATPYDPPGECWAYLVASRGIPHEGSGWRSYEFKLPAWSEHLPASWVITGPCAGLSPDDAWYRLIGWGVLPSFMLGEPGKTYDNQIWDVGFDNVSITIGKFGEGPTFEFDADTL